MFKNVVVGVDGANGGRAAIALAKHLVSPDGELTLAYVYVDEPFRSRGTSPAYEAGEEEQALELLARQRDEAVVEAERRAIGAPSVGRGLHELAESGHADLLIVGSCRRGLFDRVMVGDDTRAALNGAPCPVAIAPSGYAREPSVLREIGIAYDESPESEHALVVGRRLVAESGAKLSAFETVALPTYSFLGGPVEVENAINQLVKDARERIAALGGVEPHAAYGVPVEELTVYSASVDLLLVGSRSYGPIGRLLFGSTSQRLARSARCPLLVVTRAARAAGLGLDEAAVERQPA
jgi:nucleotide-binding universal stress UspA family protein